MSVTLKITGIGILFLLIIVTGILLVRTGRPYNPVMFNIHKFISLAGIVLGGIFVYNAYGNIEGIPFLLPLIIVTGILYIVLLVSGGLLDLDKPFHNLLQIIHRIGSPVTIIFTIVIFYILLKKAI